MKALALIILMFSSAAFGQTHSRANDNDDDTWFTSQDVGYGITQTRNSTIVGIENFGFMRNSISFNSLDRRGEIYYRGEGYGAGTKIIFKSPIINMGFGAGGYVSKFFLPAQNYRTVNGVKTFYSELTLERYLFESLMISLGARNNKEKFPGEAPEEIFQEISFAITLFGR